MQTTNIAWTTYTFNPITGCSKIGPECENCWAETFSHRQAEQDDPPVQATTEPWTHENAAENVTLHPERLEKPLAYTYPEGPGRIFVCSMADLFHKQVPESFIRRVIALCRQLPEHIWCLLTKRPHRAAQVDVDWPDNVWLGTSVGTGGGGEYPDTTHRIDQLLEADAALHWVSFEPLIEPVADSVDLSEIGWIVVGGETAAADDRREMNAAWAVDLLKKARQQDTAFFFKQHSGHQPEKSIHLSVLNDELGIYGEQVIREYPPLPTITRQARQEAGFEPTANISAEQEVVEHVSYR